VVYVPYEVVKRLMLKRWEKAREEKPGLPRPTLWEIKVEWFRMLEYHPLSSAEFFNFRDQFPRGDQVKITHRRYSRQRYSGKKTE